MKIDNPHKKDIRARLLRRLEREGRSMTQDALAAALKVKKADRASFLMALRQLEMEGEVLRTKKGKLKLSETANCRRAVMLSLSRGFAFARFEDTGEDCFIAGRNIRGALPGDTVLIRLGPEDSRGPNGSVTRILEEGDRAYSGRIALSPEGETVVESDRSIRYPLPIRRSALNGAQEGDKVRFTLTEGKGGEPSAAVVYSFGSADSARICADSIVDMMGIPSVFPAAVREEADKAAGFTEKELEGRVDLRDELIFTIDGEDAKDLDDAISLRKNDDGTLLLGVHIADVSHYVRAGGPLDTEALKRGTSVYFADRVIPMLPEELSNGACSLNPHEDKLTLSALMTLNKAGTCKELRLVKSVISSKIRGVYSEVNEIFAGTAGADIKEKYKPAAQTLRSMRALAKKLKTAAEKRGTMDLISTEARFLLDENGVPAALYPRVAGEAEGMIEQFMIAANVAVAKYARERELPFVYRVHDRPDGEKLDALLETMRVLGIPFEGTKDMGGLPRAMMEAAKDTRYARLVSERLLRCMAKAVYSEHPLGHYGLCLEDYCHFTSPIRRYPDLSIHRILSDAVRGMSKAELYRRYGEFAKDAASRSTECEIRAMNAERSCEACYKAEYMSAYIGKTFTGVISSVSEFGMYVELSNTVEGMIRPESLPDKELQYDGVASFTDRKGRPLYTVGDEIDIQVASCDISAGRIGFVPA